MTTVLWQRLEGALIAIAGFTGAIYMEPSWPLWIWLLLAFAPDLSFAAYALGPRVGALIYNAVHLYAAGAVLLAAALIRAPELAALGALWVAHCGIDRAFGYGLKEPTGFTHTHLGRIGKDKPT